MARNLVPAGTACVMRPCVTFDAQALIGASLVTAVTVACTAQPDQMCASVCGGWGEGEGVLQVAKECNRAATTISARIQAMPALMLMGTTELTRAHPEHLLHAVSVRWQQHGPVGPQGTGQQQFCPIGGTLRHQAALQRSHLGIERYFHRHCRCWG